MKKNILILVAGVLAFVGIAYASTIVYSGYLANEVVG